MSIQDDIWENSREETRTCRNCIKAGGEYNHPGFFNYDADVLLVDEAPSESHFDFPGYDRSQNYNWYKEFYEEKHQNNLFSWDFYTDFLEPVWKPLGFTSDEILEEVYMTSVVKCPLTEGIPRSEKLKELQSAFDNCQEYLKREIIEIEPEVIITAGVPATENTADILGVPASEQRDLSISKPEWWGLSKFPTDTDPPMIHMPLWFYYTNHHQLSDEEWEECLSAVRQGLKQTVYQNQ